MAKSTLSDGPCCEINKLIVQVTGNQHPASQRLAFYDHAGKRLDTLTAEDKPETLKKPYFVDSALHVWNWKNHYTHRLWLEIDSVEGSPIRLLLPEVAITLRQFDAQWNQIMPVVPFVALPGANSAHDHGTPVLCRAGFIYVFLGDRLWRELEVRVADEQTTYHDIDLNRYRMGDEIEEGPRLATGQALEDIWLPSSWNDQQVSPQLCFSEVQLSGPRLRRLEQDPALRAQRCQSPDLRSSRDKFKRVFLDKPDGVAMLEAFSAFDAYDAANQSAAGAAHVARLNLSSHAFPVSLVAPQRARQPGYEWLLDQPGRYLCDLSGQFPAIALSAARQHVVRCEKGEVAYQPTSVETGAWAHWLEQVCDPETQIADEFWQAQPAVADVLLSARKRELYGVLLHDPHYRLRHVQTRIHDQQHLLNLCAQRASHYTHHASALLVQQLIVPQTVGGQKNPLHQGMEKLKDQGRIDINRFTATGERVQLWRQLDMSQALLSDTLQQAETEQTLADHLSLDGFDYVAAMHFVSRLFASLAMTPAQMDPFAVNGDVTDAVTGISLYKAKASVGQQLISRMANEEGHALHRMLWPDLAQQDMEAPYVQPAVADINDGNGLFRPNALLGAVSSDAVDAKQLNTLDAHLLAGLLESGSLNNTLTGTLKVVAATLISFHENLQGSVDVAEQALNATQHIPVPGAERPAPALNMRQRQRALAQLRSMLPGAFGDAHFMRHQEARNKNYYVFGLTDLPEMSERLRRPHLDYRGPSGSSKVGQDHYRTGGDLRANTVVIAMPRDHRMSRLISGVNQRVNAAWQLNMTEQVTTKGTAIQDAVKSRNALQSEWMYRALNSTPFAAAVGMLELWNLRNESVAWEASEREKGQLRAIGGAVGAGLDLLIAMEALTVKLASSQSVLAAARTTLFTISETSAERVLGPLSKHFLKEFTGRLLAQIGAGSIFVGLNLYDAWHAYQWGDDAMWGHLLMAAGGLTGIASTLMVGGATFLGLGPMGWITLIAISVGAGIAYWLSSNAVEDWLRAGPFGPASGRIPHLQDPQQAFYYLVSLFADIRISSRPNPDHEFAPKINDGNPVPFSVRKANTCILIESNLPGLLSQELHTLVECRQQVTEAHYTLRHEWSHERSSLTREKSVAYRSRLNGIEVFVTLPRNQPAEPSKSRPAEIYRWLVRAQLSFNDGSRTWVFPAPPPKDPTPFGPVHAKPNFEKGEHLFWADEITHKAVSDE
ncbi:hypothetical protein [Pseudomonas sp. MH9.2]|uniref:hypothetical protein n=1 Tax=Pseudomonas sp. MH9.2 TaxID=3048629 RepID=UPI002AC8F7A4|nr:hypothetical protein [Pseudomonas sp. MH9.2]WPX69810.1 hypothetical protein RHM55_04275 [Pseudomonas sp. MH9.2]